MTSEEFKINHSTLIMNYQFIEQRLKGIYSMLNDNKSFYENILDTEKDNMKYTIEAVKKIEKDKKISLIDSDLYGRLEKIRQRRNFWCHQCYWEIAFDIKTGNVKKPEDARILLKDLREAENIQGELYQIFTRI